MTLVAFVRVTPDTYVRFPHRCPGPGCACCRWVQTRFDALDTEQRAEALRQPHAWHVESLLQAAR